MNVPNKIVDNLLFAGYNCVRGVTMDEKFNAILSVAIIPSTVDLIATKENLDELSALNEFYNSKVYELLSIEKTKLWHYSPMTVYTMWKHEKETGEIVYPED